MAAEATLDDFLPLTQTRNDHSDVKIMHNSSRPSLDAMIAVLTTVEMGSFSAAAERLDVTHGSVSRQVAAVEKWAGSRLFERHGRGVKLADHARELVAQLEAAVAIIDDSPRHIRGDNTLEVLRISVVPSFARLFLMPNIRTIEGTPQDVILELDVNRRLQPLSNARLAVRHGSGNWSGVHTTPLFGETLYPVATAEIVHALGVAPSARDLLGYPLIIDRPDNNWQTWFGASDLEFFPRPIDRWYSDYDLALMAAASGQGIALLRDPYGSGLAARLNLQRIGHQCVESKTQFYVVSQVGARTPTLDRIVARIARCALGATPDD